MALSAIFDIAKTGVLTYQKALQVVSHNIANASTEGYTRQDVIFTNSLWIIKHCWHCGKRCENRGY